MFLSEALATSVVKIAGRDVLASWKVLIALGVTPVLYTFYAILATLIVIRAQLPMQWRIATPFLTITNLPFMNYAALKFGEAGMDVLKWVDTECLISAYWHLDRSLPPLIITLIPGQQRSLNKAKQQRIQLANELAAVINEFAPKLYEDFDQVGHNGSSFGGLISIPSLVPNPCPLSKCTSFHWNVWIMASKEWDRCCRCTRLTN